MANAATSAAPIASDLMIPTSLCAEPFSQSPDFVASPAILTFQDAASANDPLRCNVPRFRLSQNKTTDPRSNEKALVSENICAGVTILQWCKGFDASLGLRLHLRRQKYWQKLPTAQCICPNRQASENLLESIHWLDPRPSHCNVRSDARLGLVPALAAHLEWPCRRDIRSGDSIRRRTFFHKTHGPRRRSPDRARDRRGRAGLGRAIALDLADHGWRVGVHYRASAAEALEARCRDRAQGRKRGRVSPPISPGSRRLHRCSRLAPRGSARRPA